MRHYGGGGGGLDRGGRRGGGGGGGEGDRGGSAGGEAFGSRSVVGIDFGGGAVLIQLATFGQSARTKGRQAWDSIGQGEGTQQSVPASLMTSETIGQGGAVIYNLGPGK